jgi:hypothetical protein
MLEWNKTESNIKTWDEAKALEVDGWRLPTQVELKNAYGTKKEGFYTDFYWSSKSNGKNYAYAVNLKDGFPASQSKKDCYSFVRLCKEI